MFRKVTKSAIRIHQFKVIFSKEIVPPVRITFVGIDGVQMLLCEWLVAWIAQFQQAIRTRSIAPILVLNENFQAVLVTTTNLAKAIVLPMRITHAYLQWIKPATGEDNILKNVLKYRHVLNKKGSQGCRSIQ